MDARHARPVTSGGSPLAVMLLVLLSARLASPEISGTECCDIWTREGWTRMRELPPMTVEQGMPKECSSNAVAPLSLNWPPRVGRARRAAGSQLQSGSVTHVSWTPNSGHSDLGISLCSDAGQSDCYMLDVLGVSPAGRLAYWWRHHAFDEPGVQSWVPGRTDHVSETLLKTEERLEECQWPDGGAEEQEIYLERTEVATVRVWRARGDSSQEPSMNFPLSEDLPFFALSPHAPLGQLNTATAAMSAAQKAKLYSDAAINPLLMRGENLLQRPGNRVIVTWRPDEPAARMGFALCRDRQQSVCFVLVLYGISSTGRMGYVWARHGPGEQGLAGWVAGRQDRVPGRVVRSYPAVAGGTWPQDGRAAQSVRVDRTQPGAVRFELQGGDPAQAAELTFPLPDTYTYFTTASSDAGGSAQVGSAAAQPAAPRPPAHRPQPPTQRPPAQRPQTQRPPTQRPATQRPQTQRPPTQRPQPQRPRPRPQPPKTTPPPPPPSPAEDDACMPAIRVRMLRNQQMLMVWEPRATSGNFGVSFCRNANQDDCYVLDTYGFQTSSRRLAYSWRYHSAKETGFGAWVPGRRELVPERHVDTNQGTPPGWQNTGEHIMMLTRTTSGTLVFRMDGMDPTQQQQLVFQLPDGYDEASVASAQSAGEYSIRGPCFNGLLFRWSSPLCHLPEAGALNINYAELTSSWTLKPQTLSGQMRSPAMSGMDGQMCVSVVGLALGTARIEVHVENIAGSGKPIKLAEIVPQGRGEWQRVHKTVQVPESLQTGQVRVVVSATHSPGRGLALLHRLEFCNPNTCGVARTDVVPLIVHGKEAKKGDFPWYAGIYKRDSGSWESICGGSLVRADVVVSAAHCFYDESSLRLYDKSQFKVAVGKYKRDWEVREPDEQRSEVIDIIVPERYRGSKRIYDNDIAFLRVQVTITALVLPVCVDWTSKHHLKRGDVGVVTGWGLTEAYSPSASLQFARMPYVAFDDCIRAVPDSLARYITSDKFCAGNVNGSTVWPGDSGGGLTFLRGGVWFLRGVVSTGVPKQLTYSAYTDLNFYIPMLTKFIASSQ